MFAFLQRRRDKEEGFTLIELMAVVLIIAILIAIAIPTFLGARSRAQDRAAQSSGRNGLTNAKTVFTDANAYGAGATSAAATADLVTKLTAAEPSLTFQTTASTGQNVVSVQSTVATGATSAAIVSMAVLSRSGTCYGLTDNSGAAVTGHPSGTTYGTIATCTGTAAEAANFSAASW